MPVPPQFLRKASKRRIDASAPPASSGKHSKKVSTFKNPGNKAGKGLMQQAGPGVGAPNSDAGQPDGGGAGNFLGLLAAMGAAKKPKTKVQPAAGRRFQQMKMAARK
jgi:hypothetical protein